MIDFENSIFWALYFNGYFRGLYPRSQNLESLIIKKSKEETWKEMTQPCTTSKDLKNQKKLGIQSSVL